MTIDHVLNAIHAKRPMSRAGVYLHLKALGIKPLGVGQRPQNYPEDTADRILSRLGFGSAPSHTAAPVAAVEYLPPAQETRIVSLKELRAIAKKSRATKGGAR